MNHEVYRQQRRDHGKPIEPANPKHEAIPKGNACLVCNGSAMWMPSLSNMRFCVKCYPPNPLIKSARLCNTNDDLKRFDMGESIDEKPRVVKPITKEDPVNRNVVLSGILGARYRPDPKYAAYEGDDA